MPPLRGCGGRRGVDPGLHPGLSDPAPAGLRSPEGGMR